MGTARLLVALAVWFAGFPAAFGADPSYRFVAPNTVENDRILGTLEDLLAPLGLNRLTPPYSTPLGRLDAVFADPGLGRALFVKLSIKVTNKSLLNRAIAGPGPHEILYHGSFYGREFAIFTSGMPRKVLGRILARLNGAELARATPFLPRIPASETTGSQPLYHQKATSPGSIYGCVLGVFEGAYDSTIGLAAGAAHAVLHPIESVKSFWRGISHSWNLTKRFWNDFSGTASQVYSDFDALSAKAKGELACRVLTDLGAGVVIGSLTAGAAGPVLSEKIAAALAKYRKRSHAENRVQVAGGAAAVHEPTKIPSPLAAESASNTIPFSSAGSYAKVYDLIRYLPMYRRVLERHVAWAKRVPAKNPVIIDAGGGTGNMTQAVRRARPDARVFLVDTSDAMLTYAKQKGVPAQNISQSDVTKLLQPDGRPFPDGSVDHVFSHSVTWALEKPGEQFQEAHRVLKKGGTFGMSTSDHPTAPLVEGFIKEIDSDLNQVQKRGKATPAQRETFVARNREFPQKLLSPLSREEAIQLGRKYGFKPLETTDVYGVKKATEPGSLFHGILFEKID